MVLERDLAEDDVREGRVLAREDGEARVLGLGGALADRGPEVDLAGLALGPELGREQVGPGRDEGATSRDPESSSSPSLSSTNLKSSVSPVRSTCMTLPLYLSHPSRWRPYSMGSASSSHSLSMYWRTPGLVLITFTQCTEPHVIVTGF